MGHRSLPAALSFSLTAALAGCLTVPLAPDQAAYGQFVPCLPSGIDLKVVPLKIAHQSAPRCVSASTATCLDQGEIVYTATLVRHPHGTFLIDASLADSSRAADIEPLPLEGKLAFDFSVDGKLRKLLAEAGGPPPDFVLITHAHWDHTSGLVDLGNPRAVLAPAELDFVRRGAMGTLPTTRPWHLRGSRVETFAWDGPPYENFPKSHDWFGDGSVILVPMPGHTPGSMGIFLNSVHGHRVLFIGDTAWSMDAITAPSHKLAPMSDLVDDDQTALAAALWRLHHLHEHEPELLIVPAHDGEALKKLQELVMPAVASKP